MVAQVMDMHSQDLVFQIQLGIQLYIYIEDLLIDLIMKQEQHTHLNLEYQQEEL